MLWSFINKKYILYHNECQHVQDGSVRTIDLAHLDLNVKLLFAWGVMISSNSGMSHECCGISSPQEFVYSTDFQAKALCEGNLLVAWITLTSNPFY